MVYYNDTLETCHPLTAKGLTNYYAFLERRADEILFKHDHPVKWFIGKVKDWFTE